MSELPQHVTPRGHHQGVVRQLGRRLVADAEGPLSETSGVPNETRPSRTSPSFSLAGNEFAFPVRTPYSSPDSSGHATTATVSHSAVASAYYFEVRDWPPSSSYRLT